MAANKEQTFGDIPYTLAWSITNATGTNKVDVAVAPAGGAGLRVDFIRLTTDLVAGQNLQFYLYDGVNTNPLGVATVAATAGTAPGVMAVEAVEFLLTDSIALKAGDKIQVAATSAITAGKTIWGSTLGVDLTSH